ncbi:MAG TPA: TadE/TadG family type IV pilus assembly protein, partial [Terriglobales bacterium]
MGRPRRYAFDSRGAGAVEFALVLPAVMFLLFGFINMFLVTYAEVNLRSAVQKAARWEATCAASGSNWAPCNESLTTYAQSQYMGPSLGANYAVQLSDACGAQYNSTSGSVVADAGYAVNATGAYQVYYG